MELGRRDRHRGARSRGCARRAQARRRRRRRRGVRRPSVDAGRERKPKHEIRSPFSDRQGDRALAGCWLRNVLDSYTLASKWFKRDARSLPRTRPPRPSSARRLAREHRAGRRRQAGRGRARRRGLHLRGHVLLEDVPGTAKTILARALAQSIEGATFSRIQCTPDLQPTDITGLSIFNQKTPRVRVPRRARSSRTSCSSTRSTARCRGRSRRCSRRWPSGR